MAPRSDLLTSASAQVAGDGDLAAFSESIELSLVDAYALATPKLTTPEVATTAGEFAAHHEQHAVALGAFAGRRATGLANPRLTIMLRSKLERAADEAAVVGILFGLENAAAATYLSTLSDLQSVDLRQLTASILPVECQHAVGLGTVAEKEPVELFPVRERQDGALEPSEYPVAQ